MFKYFVKKQLHQQIILNVNNTKQDFKKLGVVCLGTKGSKEDSIFDSLGPRTFEKLDGGVTALASSQTLQEMQWSFSNTLPALKEFEQAFDPRKIDAILGIIDNIDVVLQNNFSEFTLDEINILFDFVTIKGLLNDFLVGKISSDEFFARYRQTLSKVNSVDISKMFVEKQNPSHLVLVDSFATDMIDQMFTLQHMDGGVVSGANQTTIDESVLGVPVQSVGVVTKLLKAPLPPNEILVDMLEFYSNFISQEIIKANDELSQSV